ncbi:hypothetical protein ACA910_001159 [Epithemia clementina (nom. ined.)]
MAAAGATTEDDKNSKNSNNDDKNKNNHEKQEPRNHIRGPKTTPRRTSSSSSSSSSRRQQAFQHPDHRILQEALDQGSLTDYIDIKLRNNLPTSSSTTTTMAHSTDHPTKNGAAAAAAASLPCATSPTELDARIYQVCALTGCDQPQRIFPHAGKFEAEHLQFDLPCYYRARTSSGSSSSSSSISSPSLLQDDDPSQNNDHDASFTTKKKEGQASYEVSFQLSQAVQDDPDLWYDLIETWNPTSKVQLEVLSDEEQAQARQKQRETLASALAQNPTRQKQQQRHRRRAAQRANSSKSNSTTAAFTTTNDPRLGEQTHYETIHLLEAWKLMEGHWGGGNSNNAQSGEGGGQRPPVIVHVLDSGWDVDNHPDLGDNVWRNPGEICDDGIDNDMNGLIDDCFGWNHAEGNNILIGDEQSHGTHTAGTIGANNDNAIGVAGVAGGAKGQPGVALMIGLGFGSYTQGGFEASTVYAADHGAHISSNSWGFSTSGHFPAAMQAALDYGLAKDVLFVFAAGNSQSDSAHYPAYYPPMVAVAATDDNRAAAYFTNYGEWVNISAPGLNVLSTVKVSEGSYDQKSGTSMAAPHVAAVLALGKALKPMANSDALKGCLYNTAWNIDDDQVDSTYVGKMGAGMVNAPGFLKCLSVEGCGNYIIEDGELCDSTNLGSLGNDTQTTCEALGYDYGEVVCSPDCQSLSYSQCRSILLDETGLSGEAGSELRYQVEIDYLDVTDVRFELTYTGSSYTYTDVDLFVQKDSPPTLTDNDCQSASLGTADERCTDSRPGIYHVLVKGHTAFADVDLLVSSDGYPRTTKCDNSFLEEGEVCDGYDLDGKTCQDFGYSSGELLCGSDCRHFDISGCYFTYINTTLPYANQGEMLRYVAAVTDLTDAYRIDFELQCSSTSPSYDADLYVRKDLPPTLEQYDCNSVNINGQDEVCTLTEPGIYHIMIYAYQYFSSVNLVVTAQGYKGQPTAAPVPSAEPTAAPTTSSQPTISPAPTGTGFCRPACTECFTRNIRATGCANCSECETLVCNEDPYCCNNHWDETCGERATRLCPCAQILSPPI